MVMWWLLLFLPVCFGAPVPEKFTLSVPDGPLAVRMGSSIILPCSFSPAFTESLQVRWHRPDNYKIPVLLYEKQQIQEQPADPQYRGRVSLIGELEKGNVSLKLDNVTVEDNGEFICFVAGNKWYEQAGVQLIMKAMGSPPVLSFTYGASGQVNVTCKSEGWYPQPTLSWRNSEGSEIPSQSLYSVTGAHGFVSVTSWLLYSSSDSEWISCSVGLSEEERKESRILPFISGKDTAQVKELEKRLTTSGEEVERLKKETTGPWKEIFISFIVLLLLAGIVVLMLYRKGFIKYKDAKKPSAETQQDKSQASEGETENLLKREDLENLKQKNTDLQSALDESKREYETQKEQIKGELQRKLESKEGEIESLKQNIEELQSALDGLERLKEQIKNQGEPQKKLEDKEAEIKSLKQKTEAQVKELKERLTTSGAEVERLQKENIELQSQVNGSKGELETLKQQIKDASPQKHVLALPTLDMVKFFQEWPTMDGASAQGDLRLRREGKSVQYSKPKDSKDSQTLDTSCYVLCKDTFSSGQHYWEVRLSDKTQSEKLSWFVGVCSDTLRGQSGVSLASRNDCWLLCYNKEDGLFVYNNPVTPVQLTTPLIRLGVFLDCRAHSLIFYDAASQSCLYTFFDMNTTHPLIPVLSPGVRDKFTIDLI